jgi:hypothetical protein
MANSIIEQKPLYEQLPVGQEIIYVVSNDDAVANQTKVKFIAEVHISGDNPPVLSSTDDIIGTFKTTPNNAGVGIFDFRNIVENYVKADNMAADGSAYKTTTTSADKPHALHLIDKFSLNNHVVSYLRIQFKVEYLNTTTNIVETAAGTAVDSELSSIFNGYLKYTDVLNLGSSPNASDFGYNLAIFNLSGSTNRFLTNASTTQYANLEDYGTLSMLTPDNNLAKINLTYYDSTGSSLGTETVNKNALTGAYDTWGVEANRQMLHFGCFPANLQNWSSTFQGLVTAGTIEGGSIKVQAASDIGLSISQAYTINVNCPNLKDFEPIRLTWLNQWGAWDYYTFTKKSIRTTSTKGTTYTQLAGTWNESKYRVDSYKGGKKDFRRNATEKIKMNTGFVTEDEAVVFEELINSPEVYLLDGYQVDLNNALNQYVTPVRLTTSSFTRKTKANDRLMQYTFEIEKSKTLRTQSV